MKNFFNRFEYKGTSLKVVEKRKIWFIIPIAIVVISMVMFGIYAIAGNSFGSGLNLGIDFTGGTILTVELGTLADGDAYTTNATALENVVKAKSMNVSYTQVSGTGATKSIVLKYQGSMSEEDMSVANDDIRNSIQDLYPEIYSANSNFISFEYIGATTSADLISTAIISILVAGALILLYIIIRFEIYSGITAIIALLHDVIMIFAFTIIAHVQINSTFIAVLITIIAYSINNTIVVFDRVRENLAATPVGNHMSYGTIINKAITETLGRSINTTITTLLTITVLAIISVSTIRDFAILIIVGLVAGTFSSLCIAPSLYALIRDKMYAKKNMNNNYVATPSSKKA